ncbi:unnamed protein product [Sphagnum troendelagicum]|uniref:Uncharacterized protein n=1 Tax=Sphagnum troendelagicum TaxID=128251 RepID=A0ABP0V3C6_9BRYO
MPAVEHSAPELKNRTSSQRQSYIVLHRCKVQGGRIWDLRLSKDITHGWQQAKAIELVKKAEVLAVKRRVGESGHTLRKRCRLSYKECQLNLLLDTSEMREVAINLDSYPRDL